MKTLSTACAALLPRIVAALVLVCSLAACQSLLFGNPEERTPIISDRFILEPPDDVVGQTQIITARYEDTLPAIARRYNLGFEEIVAANPGVDPWLPGAETRIVLPTQFVLPNAPREGIVLNLASLRLFYFPKTKPGEPKVVVTHPIGIGRVGWATPLGLTKVVKKEMAPTWYVPASIRREHAANGERLPAAIGPGPDNPLGSHVLRLARPSYLIHGTNKPDGIGMRVSHGCIQLYPEDIASLYEQVPVGTSVRIVNQPFLAGWQNGTLHLEVHEPLEDDKRNRRKALRSLLEAKAKRNAQPLQIDWERASQLAAKPRGLPVPILMDTPSLEKILTSARVVETVVEETHSGRKLRMPLSQKTPARHSVADLSYSPGS